MEEDMKIIEGKIKDLQSHIENYEKSEYKTRIYNELIKEKKQ